MTDFNNARIQALTANNERLEHLLQLAAFEAAKMAVNAFTFEKPEVDTLSDEVDIVEGEVAIECYFLYEWHTHKDGEGDISLSGGYREFMATELANVELEEFKIYVGGNQIELTEEQKKELTKLIEQKL